MSQAVSSSSAPTESQLIALEAEQQEAIDRCVERTQTNVKLVDLATSVAGFTAALLGFFLALSLVDHWVVGLTTWMRFLGLLVLIGGFVWFLARRLLPVVTNPVNPVYAAKTIEQAAPALKNGLINLLLLSRHPQAVRPVIFSGLRRQAATQVATLPNESFVDHGQLIRVGYLLTGLIAAVAFYKLLSPKDPFQTVARVMAPWADIARPARVQIEGIQPGDAEIYRGQSLEILATVDGLRGDEMPSLVFHYGQGGNEADVERDGHASISETSLPMTVGDDGRTFRVSWTPDAQAASAYASYSVRAGDARSRDYQVQLLDAPHLSVERVTYEYPAYTGLAPRQDTSTGDLVAIEGTRVLIEGRANQKVRQGFLELFSAQPTASGFTAKPVQALPMQTKDLLVEGRMTLLLAADRKSSPFAAYQLRFTNERGQTNDQPARYRIQVSPDLAPVVELLEPRRSELEVPANRPVEFEVRALDPDFALSRVRMQGTVEQTTRWDSSLLPSAPHQGQWIGKATLLPESHGLQAGDVLIVWAEAEDNRHSSAGKLDPNQSRTDPIRIRITSPDPSEPREKGEQEKGEQEKGEQGKGEQEKGEQEKGEQEERGEQQGGEGQQGEGSQQAERQQGEEGQQGEGEGQQGEGQQSEGGQQGKGSQQGKGGQQGQPSGSEGAGGESSSEGGDASDQGGGTGQGSSKGSANEAGESGQESNGSSQASGRGGRSEQATRNGSPQPNQEDAAAGNEEQGEQVGGGGEQGAGGESSNDETGSDSPTTAAGQRDASSGPGQGKSSPTPENAADDGEPLPSDGSRDGDAFDRILKHMRQEPNESPNDGSSSSDSSESPGTPDKKSSKPSQGNDKNASEASEPSDDSQANRKPANQSQADGARENAGQAEESESSSSAGDENKQAAADRESREDRGSRGSSTDDRNPNESESSASSGRSEGGSEDGNKSEKTPTKNDGSKASNASSKPKNQDGSKNADRESDANPAAAGRDKDNADDQSATGKSNDSSQDSAADSTSESESETNNTRSGTDNSSKAKRASDKESAERDAKAKGSNQPDASASATDDEAADKGASDEGSSDNESDSGQTAPNESGRQATPGDSSSKPEPVGSSDPPSSDRSGSDESSAGTSGGSESEPEGGSPRDSSSKTGRPSSVPSGGEGASNGPGAEGDENEEDVADAANLEYAEKATDMALEYLKHEPQRDEVLKRLGWTPEELDAFMRRWQQMRSEAKDPQMNRQAAERLQDQLRSLGLRPQDAKRRAQKPIKDAAGAGRQSGSGSSLPPEYQEQYRAFLKSVPARKP